MIKKNTHHTNRGFTLIEMLIVVFLVITLSTLVFYNLSSRRTSQALNNGEDEIVALVNEARGNTISGENGSQYGVHFETKKAILFAGTTYTVGSSTNKEYDFDGAVTINSISLAGGSSDMVFKKLTGDTDQYGTVQITSTPGNATKTITVSKNGFVAGN